MKKAVVVLLISIFLLFPFKILLAQEKLELNFFFSPTCPHCAKEKAFLNRHSVFERKSADLLKNFYNKYNVPKEKHGLVPITFIGDRYFLGYQNDETTGEKIKSYITKKLEKEKEDLAFVSEQESVRKIKIPIIGKIDIYKLSPLAASIILGALDGFNACAMVALGFLLTVLAATGLRKRLLVIGGTFILVSGIVYFLFISAWLNLFLILPQIRLITLLVGVVIIITSVSLLREYFHNIVCKVCQINPEESKGFLAKFEEKLFKKMELVSNSKAALPLVLLGVATVAAGVNLVELVCSLGFPLAFTKLLSSLSLSTFSYYFYLFIYIVFYMIDDFIIFLIALFTLRITTVSEKYLKAVKLISGIILLVMGVLMVLKPNFLIFS